MKLIIHGRAFSAEARPYVEEFFEVLKQNNISYDISEIFKTHINTAGLPIFPENIFNSAENIKTADVAISIGGDGSFLETLEYVAKKLTPVLGINFGRLGFLTDINPQNIKQTIENLLNGNYKIDKRLMLQAESISPLFEKGMNFALNEIAISKTDTSSMIVVHAYVDNQFLNSYWADGLLVSTPRGSTGYNLSCGGPLVMPDSENFIITPICPHNLFVRPIIVSSKSKVRLKVESRSNNFLLSLDSRAEIVDISLSEIEISAAKETANLVKIEGNEFFTILRKKLKWGEDIRNRV